jgi:hypothetical protein
MIITPSLQRPYDPVIISGAWLTGLMGLPTDEIVACAHGASIKGTVVTPLIRPIQIPMQIDERAENGPYVLHEDGRLDANDELIVMASDVGGWVLTPTLTVEGIQFTPRTMVTITDPLGGQGWIYLFHIPNATATDTDYVIYDRESDAISGSNHYTLGFSADKFPRDYLALTSDAIDILEQEKVRIVGSAKIDPIFLPFDITGDNLVKQEVRAIDGPVRVTRVATYTLMVLGQNVAQVPITLFGYRALVLQPVPVPSGDSEDLTLTRVQYSNNLNEQAAGMTYYDANTLAGASIDGEPDVITTTPMATWHQIAGTRGTLINIYQGVARMRGSQSTHYEDDAGQNLYGNAGFMVQDPSPTEDFILLMATYFLTESHTANMGVKYAEYMANPLQISVWNVVTATTTRIYLPLIVK